MDQGDLSSAHGKLNPGSSCGYSGPSWPHFTEGHGDRNTSLESFSDGFETEEFGLGALSLKVLIDAALFKDKAQEGDLVGPYSTFVGQKDPTSLLRKDPPGRRERDALRQINGLFSASSLTSSPYLSLS